MNKNKQMDKLEMKIQYHPDTHQDTPQATHPDTHLATLPKGLVLALDPPFPLHHPLQLIKKQL